VDTISLLGTFSSSCRKRNRTEHHAIDRGRTTIRDALTEPFGLSVLQPSSLRYAP
jgi:hypothetical protein